jgi:hypothetical protein
MALAKLLEEAAARLEDAESRIDAAREKTPRTDSLTEWVAALSDFVRALADIQSYNNESIHEKLQEISRRTKLGSLGPGEPKHK